MQVLDVEKPEKQKPSILKRALQIVGFGLAAIGVALTGANLYNVGSAVALGIAGAINNKAGLNQPPLGKR